MTVVLDAIELVADEAMEQIARGRETIRALVRVEVDLWIPPSADATIEAKEYEFKATGLKAGTNTVSFENAGKQLIRASAGLYSARQNMLSQVGSVTTNGVSAAAGGRSR